ncbi:MAG: hypothetical protein Fur0010_22530 [Bdellovibrio sp.]
MNQDVFDWLLLIGRWVHITVAVTWIGTSIFFMWLDRSFVKNPSNQREGHVGDLWMVHGGGFYQVEKMLMGPTKAPEHLHWFKWESYWTWMSGMFLLVMIFYTGEGTFLLDSSVSKITYLQGVMIGLFSIFGAWFFYDFVWETKLSREVPELGHILTLIFFVFMTVFLCKTFSGRAAYIHVGAMLGTWMAGNVFMRIIPRQLKMVEASKSGTPVNQEWAKNAKNRSTHNTYFTLPVIFIMLSNHFPITYGHDYNWLVLILISIAGAAIRQYFILRLPKPTQAKTFAVLGTIIVIALIVWTSFGTPLVVKQHEHSNKAVEDHISPTSLATPYAEDARDASTFNDPYTIKIKGVVNFVGQPPQGKLLRLPSACAKQHQGEVYSDEVIVNNGKLQNVLVRISKGLEKRIYNDVPNTIIEIDQRGCIYKPRVAAVRINQAVEFINSDPIIHNVKSLTEKNQKFNIMMPKQGQRERRSFQNAELLLETKCSFHPWMSSYIAILDHPFYAVTNQKGEFELNGVAPGKYEIEVWHETLGVQKKEIEIAENKDVILEFSYKEKI